METYKFKSIVLVLLAVAFSACSNSGKEPSKAEKTNKENSHSAHHQSGMRPVHLSALKFQSLDMKVDTLPKRALTGAVKANGELEVPPQHEAMVTAILGANVTSIKVIEGEKIKKGQPLAYLAHPNLTRLQSDYVSAYNELQYLKEENKRQKKLYEEEVSSGREYQKARAEYLSTKGEVQSYESQLRQLQLGLERIRKGNIYDQVPVVSAIHGYVEKVNVKVGQYVEPQTSMFMVVNNDHVHADLMVFEKDVSKVKEGQEVRFTVESVPGKELKAEIYSVGKKFEKEPKAVHVHAEIKNKKDFLIPGMYISGKILTDSSEVRALPESAIIEEGGKSYIFTAEKQQKNGKTEWFFKPVEIRTGYSQDGWTEVNLLNPLPDNTRVAWKGTYYLISEMKKSQVGHSH